MEYYWLYLLVFFVGLSLLYEILRRSEKWDWLVFLALPIILAPVWMDKGIHDSFTWVKLYSVVAGVLLIMFIRFTQSYRKTLLSQLFVAVVAINILEACFAAFMSLKLAFILNSIAGIFLIITLWQRAKGEVSDSKTHDLLFLGIDWYWIIAYTIWNLGFVLLLYPGAIFKHIAILLVPVAFEFYQKGSWLQARTYSLGIYLILIFSFGSFLSLPNLGYLAFTKFAFGLSLLGFLAAGAYLVYSLKYSSKKRP
ncbi:hypothetical protein HOC01_02495 [archaeon]|jgi:hypothetical protein|nr:hypothetical protein [archaeon]MBT6697812.1 hypothetical protein [archaeon]